MNGETIAMIKALQVKSIEELKTSGGTADAGKVLTVGSDGKLIPAELEVGEGQVAVDGSLSVSGAAADAKKTGDAIASLNGSLGNIKIEEAVNPTWASGFIRSADGTVGQDSTSCVTGYVASTGFEYSYVSASGYKTKVAEYGADKSYIGIKMPLSAGSNSFTIDNGHYFRVQLIKDTGELSPTDITSDIFEIRYVVGFTDASLSMSGKPADAKAVGDVVGRVVFSGTHSYAGGSENWQAFAPSPNTKLAIRIPNNNGSSVEISLYIGRWTVVETISDSNYHIVDVPPNVSNKVIFTYRGESAVTLSILAVDITNANITMDVANLNNRLDDAESGLISTNSEINYLFKNTGYFAASEHDGYLTSNGTYSGASGYHSLTTDKIVCSQGDVFKYRGTASSSAVAALFYDANNAIVGFDRTSSGNAYADITIPAGVAYAVFSSYAANGSNVTLDVTTESSLYLKATKESPFAVRPLTAMPSYICKNLAYKPLGQLEKPYLCLVSDDGNALLNTYTIPMVLAKGVPCTFALMSASDVMQTQEDIDIVKNAITNGGCSVAQHGEHYWTTYTEKSLNQFFDNEKEFFDGIGITLNGAVLPGHYANDMVLALTGGRFGVVRSGYDGAYGGRFVNYPNQTSGARSNLYCLTSYNVIDKSLQSHKNTIDYAVANNRLIFIYWHENALTEATKGLLESVIDYAKTTSINFITLGDVLGII